MKLQANIESIEKALEDLQRQWMLKNLDIEIKISQASRMHQTKDEREIIKYSTSSAIKRKFFMHVLRGTYEDNALTASQLLHEVRCSKRKIDTIIKECEEDNWIEVYKCKKGHRHIKATPILMKSYQNYANWLWNALDETNMRQISTAISELRKQIYQQG